MVGTGRDVMPGACGSETSNRLPSVENPTSRKRSEKWGTPSAGRMLALRRNRDFIIVEEEGGAYVQQGSEDG